LYQDLAYGWGQTLGEGRKLGAGRLEEEEDMEFIQRRKR